MSHGDAITAGPTGSVALASTPEAPVTAFSDEARRIFGVQFHPEVAHTERGQELLSTFLHDLAGLAPTWTNVSIIEQEVAKVQAQVGEAKVLCALSGSVGTTGASLTASSDITLGGFSTHSAFTYAISSTTSGVSVAFTNAMSINLWGTTQSATASYSIGTDGSLWLTETFGASLELAGWHFGGMQVVMVMHGATITYSLSGSISLFSGALTGSITAALRAGSNGGQFVILLNLTADLTAHITGFNGTAKLTIYDCGTPCTSYITPTVGFRFMIGISGTSINVDTGWQTLSASSFSVPVSSAFSGSGSYNTGGFTADGVSCSGIAISMKASGNLVATLSDTGLSNSAAQLSASATISWDGFKSAGVTYGKFSASIHVTVGWDSAGVYVMSDAYDVASVSIGSLKVWDGYHVNSQKIYVFAW